MQHLRRRRQIKPLLLLLLSRWVVPWRQIKLLPLLMPLPMPPPPMLPLVRRVLPLALMRALAWGMVVMGMVALGMVAGVFTPRVALLTATWAASVLMLAAATTSGITLTAAGCCVALVMGCPTPSLR
jgi:hypothetical protein